ncbi:hypothetical protein L6164_012462 [Bauhinia variegata]|uniref:Uncharacterized protein n=1 Tax=Bauhinia variegata TaxID=167791 RepID=A0ACB9PA25_BAUVA|nr:hypothetical protein L6164_012462 [Bauhinia variegata]
MEAIAGRSSLISSSTCQSFQTTRRKPLRSSAVHATTIHTQTRPLRFAIRARKSDLQDFQSYARPSSLLAASEVKVYTNALLEKISLSIKEDKSKSLFRFKIATSKIYGSDLGDLSAGILLCLIDEEGNSILQRIPANSVMDHSTELGDSSNADMLYFQRGSVDEFIFEGPKLSKVEALWVSVESGQWRLGGISLTVINCECQPSLQEEDEDVSYQYTSFEYNFEIEDVLLGEGSDLSMLELKPSRVTNLTGIDHNVFLNESLSGGTLLSNPAISNEESMREYANLKFSLLFYDAILIFLGTCIASLSAGENAGFAFLIGGFGGFLYLLLLQRSVDELPAPESITRNRKETYPVLGRIKGPVSFVALAIGFAILASKYSSGDLQVTLTPKELIVGMMGFLTCKVSVGLSAFKPMTVGKKLPNDL